MQSCLPDAYRGPCLRVLVFALGRPSGYSWRLRQLHSGTWLTTTHRIKKELSICQSLPCLDLVSFPVLSQITILYRPSDCFRHFLPKLMRSQPPLQCKVLQWLTSLSNGLSTFLKQPLLCKEYRRHLSARYNGEQEITLLSLATRLAYLGGGGKPPQVFGLPRTRLSRHVCEVCYHPPLLLARAGVSRR